MAFTFHTHHTQEELKNLIQYFPRIIVILALGIISLSANEKWIQIESINKIVKNATAIKQLIDNTSKKDKPVPNDKKWFVLKEANK